MDRVTDNELGWLWIGTMVQSFLTLICSLQSSNTLHGQEAAVRQFATKFLTDLNRQVQLDKKRPTLVVFGVFSERSVLTSTVVLTNAPTDTTPEVAGEEVIRDWPRSRSLGHLEPDCVASSRARLAISWSRSGTRGP